MDSSDCGLTAMTRTDTGLAIVVGGKPAFRAMQALPMQTISNMLHCHWMARRFVAHGQLYPVRIASLRAGPRIGPGSRIQRCNLKRCISCISFSPWQHRSGPRPGPYPQPQSRGGNPVVRDCAHGPDGAPYALWGYIISLKLKLR